MKKYMFMIMMILITGVFATTIYIPEGYATIQEGINASENGDEIIVSPGTYVENINFAGKAVILGSLFYTTQDTSYISQTIIDGNQNGSVVTFASEEDSTSVLIGFTITNGQGVGLYPDYTGGGVFCIDTSPSIENVTIAGNSAYFGGGIYCHWSSPSLANVTITNNSADYSGGGIYCHWSNPGLENVTITGNSADYSGGGIYCWESSNPSIENVTITGNSAEDAGGGIYCTNYSHPSLVNVTITDNSAVSGGGIYCEYSSSPSLANVTITNNSAYFGGGIYCDDSRPSLENVIITGNSAEWGGGGIYCCNYSDPSLANVTISNNSASDGGGIYFYNSTSRSLMNVMIKDNSAGEDGGGIYWNSFSLSLENVTITGNSAGEDGGGICCWGSSPSLVNVTITNNSANDGGGIYCYWNSNPIILNCISWNNSPQEVEFQDDDDPNTITIAYSDIDGGEEGIETNNNGTINWLEGNIDADPLFRDAWLGDYYLSEDSPCIDTGIAYFEYEGDVLIDLSEDEYWGIAPDMGAFEYGLVNTDEVIIQNSKLNIQNYPNPFNPETNIVFELSIGSNVLIEIYNIKGQKVTTLVNEPFEAGSHKVTWNATDQSSGIYLLRFITAERSEMEKLILLK